MASPASKNVKSLEGKWAIEKSLSNDTDPVLALQGVSWLMRKTIGMATVTQHLRQSTTESGSPHISIEQTLSGGLKGTTENRTLDWSYRPHSDWLFGDVQSRSRYTTLSSIVSEADQNANANGKADKSEIEEDAKFLVEGGAGWLEECKNGEVIETFGENEKAGWTAWQVWGFAEVEVQGKKERWFVRRVVARKTKGKGVIRVQLVHSFEGELDA